MCCCPSLVCQVRRRASFAFLTPNAEAHFIFPHQESYSHRLTVQFMDSLLCTGDVQHDVPCQSQDLHLLNKPHKDSHYFITDCKLEIHQFRR